MLILAGAYFIGSFFGAGPHMLMMIGYEKISSNILLGSTILNVCLNLVLIPLYGVIGAAIATFISELVKKFFAYIFMVNKAKVDTSVLSFKKAVKLMFK